MWAAIFDIWDLCMLDQSCKLPTSSPVDLMACISFLVPRVANACWFGCFDVCSGILQPQLHSVHNKPTCGLSGVQCMLQCRLQHQCMSKLPHLHVSWLAGICIHTTHIHMPNRSPRGVTHAACRVLHYTPVISGIIFHTRRTLAFIRIPQYVDADQCMLFRVLILFNACCASQAFIGPPTSCAITFSFL